VSCSVPGLGATATARVVWLNPNVVEAAQRYGVDPVLVHAVVWVESHHVPTAVSDKGAAGPMQLMPATSKAMSEAEGVPNDPMDPRLGILLGTAFLARLLRRYGGDAALATAAYYAGPGRVPITGPVPPIAAGYVAKVQAAMPMFEDLDASCSGPMVPSPRRRSTRADPVVVLSQRKGSGGGAGGLLIAVVLALAGGRA